MPRPQRLDQPFVDVAYGAGNRRNSAIVEALVVAALAWLHGWGGGAAIALGIVCGIGGGLMDRAAAMARWPRLSRITLREVLQAGRSGVLPPQSLLRRILPALAFLGGVVLLWRLSARGAWLKGLSLPFLYVAWLFGRDLLLCLAPPKGGRT